VFTFDVTPDEGELYRVTATSRDVVHWERTGKGRSLAQIGENARMTDLVDIAYIASVRHRLYEGKAEDFRASVDVEVIDTTEDDDLDDESGPTQRDR
jgi:hypothetical protein